MRTTFKASAIAAAVALLTLSAAHAQRVSTAADETAKFWFVELAGAPVADGRSARAVRAEKAAFRRAARAAGVRYTERRSFDTLFNGFSVAVHPAERAKLPTLPGVKAMYPVEIIAAPTPEHGGDGSAPDLVAAIGDDRRRRSRRTRSA